MSEKTEKAIAYHKKGYNCAQSVLCTYCDRCGVEEAEAFRMAEGFGLGMGNMEGTCGALTGAFMAVGLINSDGNLEEPRSKKDTYRKIRELYNVFKEKNGSVICKELKGVDGGAPLRSCDGCIEDAAQIVEDFLSRQEKEKDQ